MTGNAVNAVAEVDKAFLLIFGTSAVILVLITAAMLWFVYRYNRKRHPEPADIEGSAVAETIWTVVPTLLVMGMFYYGWTSYTALRTVPDDAMRVKVTARMWSWSFEYENGKKANALRVPVGRAVRLDMTSVDVLHGFYAPAFRIKIDTVPGMPTNAWFRAEQTGVYDIFCTVYCGQRHANMISRIEAVEPAEFESWLASAETAPASPGKAALEKHGCLSCHTTDGSPSAGPTLQGVWGRKVAVQRGGAEQTVDSDENYLKRAILEPEAEIVKGFDPIMPSYQGQIPDAELKDILDYLKNGDAPAAAGGTAVLDAIGCLACHSTDGSELVGPSFKGMLGSTITLSAEGSGGKNKTAVVDRDFVRTKLRTPDAMRAKGFDAVMPAYPDLRAEELDAVLAALDALADHAEHHHP